MNLVEQIGSGIQRIRDLCRDYGVAEPKFEVSENWVTVAFPRLVEGRKPEATEQVTEQVERLLLTLGRDTCSTQELMNRMGLLHRPTFVYSYLQPAIQDGLIEMTIPEKPRSSRQRYRLSDKGKQVLQRLERNES